MSLASGARLDTYEIVAPLGAGGMGEVWLARDLRLQRKVAIKLLPAGLTQQAARVSRFQREARAASALNHSNVCTIYALGETPDGHQFIAMELVEGVTLRGRLASGRLRTSETLDLTIQIASALTATHAAGIVHRDLKPENAIVRPDGVVKVLDFGLAKLTAPGTDDGGATRTVLDTNAGTVMGTVAYMSPEQARGEDVDGRTDVWSLGVVLYEMLAGQLPFAGRSPSDVLAAILEHEPPPLAPLAPDVPSELQRIVGKALKKDRERRYQGMRDLQLDLEALRDDVRLAETRRTSDVGAVAPASPAPSREQASAHVRRAMPVAAFVATAAVAAGGGWWMGELWRARTPEPKGLQVLPSLTRVTFDAGLQTDVAWSPDGRSLAYTSDKAGNFDIWVQSIGGDDSRRITTSPSHDRQPTWSPDGSTLVFRSERDGGGLFVVPARGGAERRLTSFGVRPKWAPDGSQILFAASDILAGGVASPLYTVRLDGKPPKPVLQAFMKDLVGGLGGMRDWNWYPDSRHVSVLGVVSGQGHGVYTVPLSGGPVRLLKQAPELGDWASFVWASPTTLFVDCDSHGVHSLARLTVDPATMAVRGTERITLGDTWEPRFALSADGRRLAFTMTNMAQRLWVLPLDSATGLPTGNGEPVTESVGLATTSDLSRDGSKLVYVLGRQGSERTDLWMTDLATSASRELASDDQQREFPQWSQDGKHLAYRWERAREGASEMGLAVRRTDTNEEELISTPRTDAFVTTWDWSPDGQSILVSSGPVPFVGKASLGLWPVAAAPHAETAVKVLAVDDNYAIWQGRFSPDGRWICFSAFDRRAPGTASVFVIPSGGADRSHWIAVTGLNGWADKPRWSRDGKLIYFVQADSFFNVWAVRFDGAAGTPAGVPFLVTRYDSPRHQLSPRFGAAEIGVSVHRLMLTIAEQTGNIWTLDSVSP